MKSYFLMSLFVGLSVRAFSQSGSEVYATYCSGCHGQQLEEGRGPSLIKTTWKNRGDRASIIKTVKEGVPDTQMTKWEGILTDKEIEAVADYILTMQKRVAPKPKQKRKGH